MPTTKTSKNKKEKITLETPGGKYFYANGKRKTSVARVRLYKGKGAIVVNGKDVKEYFPIKTETELIKVPFKLTGNENKFDTIVKVEGGGIHSQAEAIRHGISKALVVEDELNKTILKKAGLITRDARVKERKKYGLKRARKAPQFSKR